MEDSYDDEEDEELKLAIALSLRKDEENDKSLSCNADDSTSMNQRPSNSDSELQKIMTTSSGPICCENKPSGFLGLDRRAMEEARLARAKKMNGSISPPTKSFSKRTATEAKLETYISNMQDRKQQKTSHSIRNSSLVFMPPLMPHQTVNYIQPDTTTSSRHDRKPRTDFLHGSLPPLSPYGLTGRTNQTSGLQFPKGVIKKTWAYGFPREDDIKIEEVLQRTSLQLAVLSSFQWDMEWIMSKLNTQVTNIVLVMQAKDETTKKQYRSETENMPNLRLSFPPMSGNVNCMHSKLMLLSHPNYLRVAVPSANLIRYDWGESGVMENSVFLVDIPRLPEARTVAEGSLTEFAKELIHFCKALGLQKEVVDSMYNFDFTATKHLAFVHSIGGEHTDEGAWLRTGYPGLGRAVQLLGLHTQDEIRVDFVASSVGAVGLEFLTMIYLAAQGDDGTREYNWRTKSKGKSVRNADKPDQTQLEIEEAVGRNFRIYFPSRSTVDTSNGGKNAAGVICFQKRWYDSPKFPRKVLLDCESSRAGVLMHNKLLYVQSTGGPSSSPTSTASHPKGRAWVYVGSANCSEGAWGRLVHNKTTKKAKLSCRNWECGVVVPVPTEASTATFSSPDTLDVFKGTAPVPMRVPASRMGSRTPWFFMND